MFQFPITSLWQDHRLLVAFKSPGVEETCADPIRFSRWAAGSTWDLHLWIDDEGDYFEFFRTGLSA